MTFKQKTFSSIGWSAGAQIGKQGLQFIISVIVARLLTPEDFGLLGMILVFTGFAGLFSELGFGAALIQRQEIEERHLLSIFWLNIVSGLILTGIVIAVAPLIAAFYNEPRLKVLTMLISLNFFIGSLNTVQKAILNRSMDFRKLAIIETLTMAIAGGFAITLAFIGFGVWSLAWQMLISTTVGVIMMWQVSDWKPRLCFDKNAVKELIGFSSNLLGFNVFNYWVRNSDDLLIGKFIGSVGLGIYTRAYSIMLMPLSQISATVGQVMFPSLSKIQDDKVRVKQIYLKVIGAIALITLPMMTGLLVVADSFILTLLGPKWIDVIPILRILCLIGMIQSIITTVGWIYNSQGRTDLMFRWGMTAGTIGIISFIIGIWIGSVRAVAYCYTIANFLLLYHNFTIPGKLINMTFSEVVSNVRGVFGCALLMAGGVWLLGIFMPPGWPHWAHLLVQVPFGMALYIILIHFFKLSAYLELKELLREQLGNHFVRSQKQ